jgi:hypothetical protein
MIPYTRVTGAIVLALILAACAANTQSMKPTAQSASTGAQNTGCISEKDSGVNGSGADCAVAKRTYSSVDVGRTGVTNAGKALQLLDPSVVSTNH